MTKIAFIGDSITWGLFILGRRWNTVPSVLQRYLGEGYEVMNFGASNATAQKVSDDPYWKRRAYRRSLEYNPDIVLIMMGANYTKKRNWMPEAFENDYEALVRTYMGFSSHPEVFICTTPRIFDVCGVNLMGLSGKILQDEQMSIVLRVAEKLGVKVIDTNSVLNTIKDYVDGVHPNNKGARKLAEFVYLHLQNAGLPRN